MKIRLLESIPFYCGAGVGDDDIDITRLLITLLFDIIGTC